MSLQQIRQSLGVKSVSRGFRGLLDRRVRFIMLIALGLAFFQQISGINAIFYYLPTIFAQAGGAVDTAFRQAVIVGLVNVGLTFVAIWLIDKLGRKPLLIVRRPALASYRKVLVAVDFSPHSRTALAWAGRLGALGEVHALHVYEIPFEGMLRYSGVDGQLLENYRREAHADANAEMRRFVADWPFDARRLHTEIAGGEHIPSALRQRALALDADLVVVGKHGKSIAEQLLLGSVTLHLLAECPCDVLVAQ